MPRTGYTEVKKKLPRGQRKHNRGEEKTAEGSHDPKTSDLVNRNPANRTVAFMIFAIGYNCLS